MDSITIIAINNSNRTVTTVGRNNKTPSRVAIYFSGTLKVDYKDDVGYSR